MSARVKLLLPVLGSMAFSACVGSAPSRDGSRRVSRIVPPQAKAVVRTAKTYLPEEEKTRPTPKDCSDFVYKVFSEHALKLPRTAVEMSLSGSRVASSKDLRMGDLVFFSGAKVSRAVGHVGIYVNNGIFIHLSKPDAGVSMESLYSDYYRQRYLTARRVFP